MSAHTGPVTALEGYDGHVWSSGGSSMDPSLKEWGLDGRLACTVQTPDIGAFSLCCCLSPTRAHCSQ